MALPHAELPWATLTFYPFSSQSGEYIRMQMGKSDLVTELTLEILSME